MWGDFACHAILARRWSTLMDLVNDDDYSQLVVVTNTHAQEPLQFTKVRLVNNVKISQCYGEKVYCFILPGAPW